MAIVRERERLPVGDTVLAQMIVENGVVLFGESMRNKHDSPSCMFDVRKLLSNPDNLRYIGARMGEVIRRECSGSAIVGLATSGIPWATLASLYSDLPLLYVRKKKEPNVSNKYLEGILPQDRKLILIDDLLFAGESKGEAIEILLREGCTVTDVVVVVNRQIQRVKDGPDIETRWGVKLHSLINMSEVISYMVEMGAITEAQFQNLVNDYNLYRRWDPPYFVKGGVNL